MRDLNPTVSCERQWEEFQGSLQVAQHFLLSVARTLAADDNRGDEERKRKGTAIQEKSDACVQYETRARAMVTSLQEFKADLEAAEAQLVSDSSALDGKDVVKVFGEMVKSNLQMDGGNARNDKSARELRSLIEGLRGEDLLVTQDILDVNTTCPITGMEMVDPVKNSACGHSYSKAGILAHIQQSAQPKCPVPGCGHLVTVDSLERDVDLEMTLRQKRRLEATATAQDDDVEDING